MKLRGSVCSEQLETSEVEDLSGYKRDLRKTNFGVFRASNIHPLLGLALLTVRTRAGTNEPVYAHDVELAPIKTGRAFNESLHGFLGNRWALRAAPSGNQRCRHAAPSARLISAS